MEYEMRNGELVAGIAEFIFSDNKYTQLEMSMLEARRVASDAAASTYQDGFTQTEWADAIYAKLGYI